MKRPRSWYVLICLCFAKSETSTSELERIENLARQWSPLIWLAPGEEYMPSSVEYFLENISIADENGNILENSYNPRTFQRYTSKSLHLVTKESLGDLRSRNDSFLHGQNPRQHPVPIYAVVTYCGTSNVRKLRHFHVSYWSFYPYNEGKDVCFLGKVPTPMIFGRCFGHFRKMGNHVGDWEHMSLYFSGSDVFPEKMFLAVHDAGVYYYYDPKTRLFRYESQIAKKGVARTYYTKFPPFVRMQGGHPVLFSARGSHGSWASPGDYDFARVPRLFDINGYGVPWKTWTDVRFFHRGRSKTPPDWMAFDGKWGNPKKDCLLFKKLGLCEFFDGPAGLPGRRQDFRCWPR